MSTNPTIDDGAYLKLLETTPQRFSIVSLWTNEEVVAQRNPPSFEDEVGTEWERLSPLGQSHQRMHYKNTNNYTVSLDLRFRAYSQPEFVEMNRARHLLLSWVYPMGEDPGGTPQLLATWPLMFAITCYLRSVKFKNERFLRSGACVDWTASLTLEECRDTMITSDQVALALVVRGEL